MNKKGYVYIMTNEYHTTLYVGVTSAFAKRIVQHKEEYYEGAFTQQYNLKKLVYYREFERITDAILWEKKLKKWRRTWKEELIENKNPNWNDLYPDSLPDHLFIF